MRTIALIMFIFSGICQGAPLITRSLSRAASTAGVPLDVLKAICQAESNLNPYAFVYHDGGPGKSAVGMCQILVSTAKDYVKVDKGCYSNLNESGLSCNLFDPYTNALVAAKYLKSQYLRYNKSWLSAIASYNSGSLKTCKTGVVTNSQGKKLYKCEIGGLLNQRYLDRVLSFMRNKK